MQFCLAVLLSMCGELQRIVGTQWFAWLINGCNTILPHRLKLWGVGGGLQNQENWSKTAFLRIKSSTLGSPGSCLVQNTVHCCITSSPNTDSLASFTTWGIWLQQHQPEGAGIYQYTLNLVPFFTHGSSWCDCSWLWDSCSLWGTSRGVEVTLCYRRADTDIWGVVEGWWVWGVWGASDTNIWGVEGWWM